MEEIDFGRRKFLKGLVTTAAALSVPSASIYANRDEDVLEKFGLTGNLDENLEVVKSLSPKDFHTLYGQIGFEKLRDLTRDSTCGFYPTGHKSIENMRGLLGIINEEAKRTDISSRRIFSHVFMESRGENDLNCENGGGIMHLISKYHWQGINPLNEKQNLRKGVNYLKTLKEEFNSEDLASLSFNIGDSVVRGFHKKINKYFEKENVDFEITPERIFWSMKKNNYGELSEKGRRYLKLLEGTWNDLIYRKRVDGKLVEVTNSDLFHYNERTNEIRYIGPKEGIPILKPELPSRLSYKKALWLEKTSLR